ncbi:hypothetical protein PoB_006489700 [Plakobranchus ocellatus]|uniref:Uncharacterized protein n=1 Tax=Plakobranchus ocellatus TaxID=259542 RepID=A0AAV4D2H3_9GAST|nr:hypothetical protein PoB_006489700 [Plakobranchus ocellatus]
MISRWIRWLAATTGDAGNHVRACPSLGCQNLRMISGLTLVHSFAILSDVQDTRSGERWRKLIQTIKRVRNVYTLFWLAGAEPVVKAVTRVRWLLSGRKRLVSHALPVAGFVALFVCSTTRFRWCMRYRKGHQLGSDFGYAAVFISRPRNLGKLLLSDRENRQRCIRSSVEKVASQSLAIALNYCVLAAAGPMGKSPVP